MHEIQTAAILINFITLLNKSLCSNMFHKINTDCNYANAEGCAHTDIPRLEIGNMGNV